MLLEACNIEWLSPEEYDELLAMGWFRGRGIMFRAGIICFDGGLQSTLNIRIPVADFVPKKSHRKLLRRNRSKYRIVWNVAKTDDARNALFNEHAKRFKEYTYATIEEAFLTNGPERQFEEYECAVYLGDELVALSYVDVGANAMASIMCCFGDQHSSDSLGIYTMLEEIEFAKNKGVAFYYPGYVMDQSKAFDYKLSLGPVEWLTHDGIWQQGDNTVITHTPLQVISDKMHALHEMLSLHGVDASLRYYPFFSAGFMQTPDRMLHLPAFFVWKQEQKTLAAGYDVDEERYLFFEPMEVPELGAIKMPNFTDEFKNNELYETNYIKIEFCVYFDTFNSIYGILKEILSAK